MIKVKIDNWIVSFRREDNKPFVKVTSVDGRETTYSIDRFFKFGMTVFPKELYNKIKELRYANLYDKFLDKIDPFLKEYDVNNSNIKSN